VFVHYACIKILNHKIVCIVCVIINQLAYNQLIVLAENDKNQFVLTMYSSFVLYFVQLYFIDHKTKTSTVLNECAYSKIHVPRLYLTQNINLLLNEAWPNTFRSCQSLLIMYVHFQEWLLPSVITTWVFALLLISLNTAVIVCIVRCKKKSRLYFILLHMAIAGHMCLITIFVLEV